MKQEMIMGLLKEAADPNCSTERQNGICCELEDNVYGDEEWNDDLRGGGMKLIVNVVFMFTVKNRPEILPSLFPVFAILCGDREDLIHCSEVDWSLLE